MHHTGHEVQAREGRHHNHKSSMEEGEEGESVLHDEDRRGTQELEQLNGPAEEEVTVAESVL